MGDWYKWFWTKIGGRPWTFIIRDSVKNNLLAWILGFGAVEAGFGIVLAHLFW